MAIIRLTRSRLRGLIKEALDGFPLDFDPEFDNHFPDCEDDSPSDGPYVPGITTCGCEQRKSDILRYGTDTPDETPMPDPVASIAIPWARSMARRRRGG